MIFSLLCLAAKVVDGVDDLTSGAVNYEKIYYEKADKIDTKLYNSIDRWSYLLRDKIEDNFSWSAKKQVHLDNEYQKIKKYYSKFLNILNKGKKQNSKFNYTEDDFFYSWFAKQLIEDTDFFKKLCKEYTKEYLNEMKEKHDLEDEKAMNFWQEGQNKLLKKKNIEKYEEIWANYVKYSRTAKDLYSLTFLSRIAKFYWEKNIRQIEIVKREEKLKNNMDSIGNEKASLQSQINELQNKLDNINLR